METPYRSMTLVPPRAPRPWRRYAVLALAVGALGAGVWVWRWWHRPP